MNELYHHGIKGQKWGVRRYQNADGSLTPAGQKRYNDGSTSDGTTTNNVKNTQTKSDNSNENSEYKKLSKEETSAIANKLTKGVGKYGMSNYEVKEKFKNYYSYCNRKDGQLASQCKQEITKQNVWDREAVNAFNNRKTLEKCFRSNPDIPSVVKDFNQRTGSKYSSQELFKKQDEWIDTIGKAELKEHAIIKKYRNAFRDKAAEKLSLDTGIDKESLKSFVKYANDLYDKSSFKYPSKIEKETGVNSLKLDWVFMANEQSYRTFGFHQSDDLIHSAIVLDRPSNNKNKFGVRR